MIRSPCVNKDQGCYLDLGSWTRSRGLRVPTQIPSSLCFISQSLWQRDRKEGIVLASFSGFQLHLPQQADENSYPKDSRLIPPLLDIFVIRYEGASPYPGRVMLLVRIWKKFPVRYWEGVNRVQLWAARETAHPVKQASACPGHLSGDTDPALPSSPTKPGNLPMHGSGNA